MAFQWLLRGWLLNAAKQQAYEAARETVREHVTRAREESREPQPKRLPAPCDVGLVFALGMELGGLEDRLTDRQRTAGAGFVARQGALRGRRLVIMESGVGRRAAALATEAAIDGHQPQWVISAGFAGALQGDLNRHDLVVANAIKGPDGKELIIDVKADLPGVRVGRLLTVDDIVHSAEEKAALGKQHDALAVDMESYAVAEVCQRRQVRCLAIRVISDAVEDELPKEIEHLARQKTNTARVGAAFGAVFRRPGSLKDMYKLKEDALVASDRLAALLEDIITRLAPRDESA